MINVYYGSCDYAVDRFMYNRIAADMPGRTILMVPDQFTLKAEEDALKYMNADVLMNLEVMSRTGFSRRVLGSTSMPAGVAVNKYGRYMLLSSMLASMEPDQGVFSNMLVTGRKGRAAQARMLSDEISELKQFGITAADLSGVAGNYGDDVLGGKLAWTADIYRAYQEKISGRFSDSDDSQAAVAARLADFPRVRGCIFWIYGFDYMSPDMMELIYRISEQASAVNIVLTGEKNGAEEFDIFRRMTSMLKEKCAGHGAAYSEEHVPEEYRSEKNPEISVIGAGGFYEEAETIASDIVSLVRDRGFRYRDIAVICNDLDVRGAMIRRVFEQYGIPLFVDKKRAVMQEPAVEFICAMIDSVAGGMQYNDVFRMLASGFSPLADEQCDRLAMYCERYHIKSGRWKKDFKYGLDEEGQDGLAEINQSRKAVYDFMEKFRSAFRSGNTVKEKTAALYEFLTDTVNMPRRMAESAEELEGRGMHEYAETAAQVWKMIVDIMDQMVEVIGGEKIDNDEYGEILREGFEAVEIGIVPSTADQVLLGTMRRTRTGNIRALFVAGANDGVLPEDTDSESIFTDREKEEIENSLGRAAGSTGMLRSMEQDLAIYRNLGRAGDVLTILYSSQDPDGKELRPSVLVHSYLSRYGEDIRRGSAADSADLLRLIQTPGGTVPRMAEELRKAYDHDEAPADEWKAAALVMTGTPQFENMKRGLFYSWRSESVSRKNVESLYGRGKSGSFELSASSIERYSRCPFSFFISYGLKPKENREFDVDSRSVGDIFHYCLKRASAALSVEGLPVTDPSSPWMTVTEEDLRAMISEYAADFAENYREGVFGYSAREKYMLERAEEVIYMNVAVMINQVRKGHIKAVFFEEAFGPGRGRAFPPIRLELAGGGTVYLEGRIDRVDVLRGSETDSDYVRIIDYKTGADKLDRRNVESGVQLQLMIYLKGALGAGGNAAPAGVFYFPAGEKTDDISDRAGDESEAYGSDSRLNGILVKDDDVIRSMDDSLDTADRSDVIPVIRTKSGYKKSASLMDREEFEEMMDSVDHILSAAAEGFASGRMDVAPNKTGSYDPCRFCGYRSICHVDVTGGKAG